METIEKGLYRHYKGNLYEVIDIATHSETLELLVIYRSKKDKNKLWVRPLSMWNNLIEVNGNIVKRFEKI